MFCQKIRDLKNQQRQIVYVDESGFANDMPRTYGYSVRGQRCYGCHDWGSKGRTKAIGALIGNTLGCYWTVDRFSRYVSVYMLGGEIFIT